MSLVRAERRRFMKRRLIRWSLVTGVVLLGIISALIFINNQKVSPETIAAAQAQAEASYQENLRGFEEYKKSCETRQNAPECEKIDEQAPPPREAFRAEYFMPPTFDFRDSFGGTLMVWAAIIAVIAFVIGASFVGAEWSTGSMMSLLTWRPKRMTVLGTKLGVLLGWLTAIGVVTFGLWTAAMWLTGTFRGNTDRMTSGVWQSFGLTGLRGIGLILAAGAIGFGLAALGRHTGVALGVALGTVIVGQIGLAIVLGLAQVPFFQMYLIPTHLQAWMEKSITVGNPFGGQVDCSGPLGCIEPEKTITWQFTGSLTLAAIAAVLALAFWQMRRRDIS